MAASLTARLADSLTAFMTGSLKDTHGMMAMLNRAVMTDSMAL